MPKIRPAIAQMQSQGISQIARLGAGRADVFPLWFGESDFVTPTFIRAAATQALEAGQTFYVDRRGIPPLRQEIRAYLQRLHGVSVDLNRVTVTASGMTAIMIAVECLVNNGDNVVIVSPIWPNVVYAVEALGGHCRHVRLRETGRGWTLDTDDLLRACDDRTRAIFIASPSNPTGWVMTTEQQAEVLAVCRSRGIWVISDEVYHRLAYDQTVTPSFLQVAEPEDPLFVVQSFSKTWAMTGWRLGWLIHPASIADRIGDLSAINNTGATSFVQHAGIVALRDGEPFVADMRARFRENRSLTYDRLAAIRGVRAGQPPPAAFFAFFSVAGVQDDLQFAKDLLLKSGVGVAPGSAFGPQNEGYLRLCFALQPSRLSTALDRLETGIRALAGG